ncbi:monovalent cation/H+ antiporter subunit D family protein [Alphaproteobacteria bacterium]|nr:monovalent cation/H+ antiporter subunit D family protein [Alphaproteobacteria bacterium]
MIEHAPILQIVIPLLAAPFAVLLRKPLLAWLLALAAVGSSFVISLYLFNIVSTTGQSITYEIGSWPSPIGIVYVIDAANAYLIPLISGIALVVTFACRDLIDREIDRRDQTLFYTAWLLTIAGMLGQLATGDAFNIFVFLEISSLSAYALVAMGAGKDRRALPAAYNYLILGTIGATFYTIGIGFLYMLTGTLNLADMAERLPAVADNHTAFAGLAFIALGLFLKMALFPLHFWLVPAYSYAPSAVSTLMAATATKVSAFILIRLVFGVFGIDFPGMLDLLGIVLISLGAIGAVVGTVAAILETDLKRIFAQSSIAQLGYIAMGMGLASNAGLAASFIHLFNHALIKGALFLAVGALVAQLGTVTLTSIRGIGRQAPMTTAAILVGGLALLGVPLTAGFISKFYLISAQLQQEAWGFAAITVLSSVLALIYVWKIVEAAYLSPRPAGAPVIQETPSHWLPAWVLVAATIYFGVQAQAMVQAAFNAANMFIGGAQ